MATIAFDVYGTLIDTDGVVDRLREWIGSQAETFSQTWRSKQLEYSFRRGLMRRYENFAVCTRHALDYCCAEYEVSFSAGQKEALLQSFSFPLQFEKIIHQVYFIGVKSVLVICLTGAFTGMVLGLQGYYTLTKFGSEGFLGAAVALSLIRELGQFGIPKGAEKEIF